MNRIIVAIIAIAAINSLIILFQELRKPSFKPDNTYNMAGRVTINSHDEDKFVEIIVGTDRHKFFTNNSTFFNNSENNTFSGLILSMFINFVYFIGLMGLIHVIMLGLFGDKGNEAGLNSSIFGIYSISEKKEKKDIVFKAPFRGITGDIKTPDLVFQHPDSLPEIERVYLESFELENLYKKVAYMNDFLQTSEEDVKIDILPPHTIFVGDPGIGKTFLCKYIAKKNDCYFLQLDKSFVSSPYIAQGAINIEFLKKSLKDFCKKNPKSCLIICFDEVEELIKNRSDNHSYSTSDMLRLFDDLPRRNVIVLGTSNNLKRVDPAAVRYGRFSVMRLAPSNMDNFVKSKLSSMSDEECDLMIPKELLGRFRGMSGLSSLIESCQFNSATSFANVCDKILVERKDEGTNIRKIIARIYNGYCFPNNLVKSTTAERDYVKVLLHELSHAIFIRLFTKSISEGIFVNNVSGANYFRHNNIQANAPLVTIASSLCELYDEDFKRDYTLLRGESADHDFFERCMSVCLYDLVYGQIHVHKKQFKKLMSEGLLNSCIGSAKKHFREVYNDIMGELFEEAKKIFLENKYSTEGYFDDRLFYFMFGFEVEELLDAAIKRVDLKRGVSTAERAEKARIDFIEELKEFIRKKLSIDTPKTKVAPEEGLTEKKSKKEAKLNEEEKPKEEPVLTEVVNS